METMIYSDLHLLNYGNDVVSLLLIVNLWYIHEHVHVKDERV